MHNIRRLIKQMFMCLLILTLVTNMEIVVLADETQDDANDSVSEVVDESKENALLGEMKPEEENEKRQNASEISDEFESNDLQDINDEEQLDAAINSGSQKELYKQDILELPENDDKEEHNQGISENIDETSSFVTQVQENTDENNDDEDEDKSSNETNVSELSGKEPNSETEVKEQIIADFDDQKEIIGSDEYNKEINELNLDFFVDENNEDIELELQARGSTEEDLTSRGIVDIKVPVTSVTISGQKTVLKVGDKDYPKVTVLPETATNRNVVWTSKNSNVASVNSSGQIQAVGVGKTTITATAEDDSSIFDIYVLEVLAAYDDDTAVKSVKITNGKPNMRAGEILALAYEVLPVTAKNKAVSWSSSDTSVAKINEYGVVTATGEGECTISMVSDENYAIIDSYKVKVAGVVYPTSIKCWVAETPVVISETRDYHMAYEMLPADVSNTKVIWSSSDTSVVSINAENGTLRAHKLGKAIITAKAEQDPEVYGQFVINVYNNPVTSIAIKGKGQMVVNETQTLIADIEPTDATNKDVKWSSSNSEIVTVDSATGVVKALNTGTVEISVISADNNSITSKKSIIVTPMEVKVESIYLTGRTRLEVGDESLLVAHINPETATNQLLWWDSDDYSVVTVDQTGKIYAHAPGTAVVSAIATDGTLIRGKTTVTVKAGVTHVTNVSVASNTDVVLYPNAKYYSSYEILPMSADDKSVTWSSSNEKVARVDPETGVVTALSTGNAEIKATSNDDSSLSDKYVLYVKDTTKKVTKVAVYGKPNMGVGETYPMSYEIWPVDADIKTVTWASTDSSVASVNEYGVVTAHKEGTTFIRATATDGSDQKGEFRIAVNKVSNKVTRVEIHGSTTLSKGAVDYLAYEIWPVNASDKSVSWKSSNTKVATVNEYGVVNAVSAGTSIISAVANDGSNESASYLLTVTGSTTYVSALAIHGTAIMSKGSVQYLAYEAWPINADNKTVVWNSSNPKVAIVDSSNGTVNAVSAGTTIITATAKDGSGVSTTFTLSVTNAIVSQKVTALAIHGKAKMKPSEVQYLAYEAWPTNATDKTVKWTSSDTKVVTVDTSHGIVKAVGNGTATITVKANDGSGVTASYTITVTNSTQLTTALAIHGDSTMTKGMIQYMAYEAWPVDADDKSVSWESSNLSVLSVDANNGTVKAINAGDAILTITANDGSGKTATFSIHVN